MEGSREGGREREKEKSTKRRKLQGGRMGGSEEGAQPEAGKCQGLRAAAGRKNRPTMKATTLIYSLFGIHRGHAPISRTCVRETAVGVICVAPLLSMSWQQLQRPANLQQQQQRQNNWKKRRPR
jgi:hypothetical protein